MRDLADIAKEMISVLEEGGEGDEQAVVILRSGLRTLSQVHGFVADEDPMRPVAFLVTSAMHIARANGKQVVAFRMKGEAGG
jgi:hypothetical protein